MTLYTDNRGLVAEDNGEETILYTGLTTPRKTKFNGKLVLYRDLSEQGKQELSLRTRRQYEPLSVVAIAHD